MHLFPVAKGEVCDWYNLAQVCTPVAKEGDGNRALGKRLWIEWMLILCFLQTTDVGFFVCACVWHCV
jgi:hypothetical protein